MCIRKDGEEQACVFAEMGRSRYMDVQRCRNLLSTPYSPAPPHPNPPAPAPLLGYSAMPNTEAHGVRAEEHTERYKKPDHLIASRQTE